MRDTGKGYTGHVTGRDVEAVNVLIEEPGLSLEKLGERLGVTKQAAAERKSRLEAIGLTRTWYFWNVTPRFECTKRVRVAVERGSRQAERVLEVLDDHQPIVVLFRTAPGDFFRGEAPSLAATIDEVEGVLLLSDAEEEARLRSEVGRLGVSEVSVEPVLLSRLLGERCDVIPRSRQRLAKLARDVARELSSEGSTLAVLWEPPKETTDQIDLVIVRSERHQPRADSYERRVEGVLVDLHFMSHRRFAAAKREWAQGLEVLFARDEEALRKVRGRASGVRYRRKR